MISILLTALTENIPLLTVFLQQEHEEHSCMQCRVH